MTFFVCGSSYSSGDGLLNRLEQRWSTIFSGLINEDVENYAKDGGSTDFVIYTTIKNVLKNDYKKVIITWPPIDRIMLVRRENNFLIEGNATHTNNLYGNQEEFVKFLSLYYKNWTNDLFTLKITLQKILLLQTWLQNANCQYLFINTNSYNLSNWLNLNNLPIKVKKSMLDAFDNMDDEQILAEQEEIKMLVSQLNLNIYDPIKFDLTSFCTNLNLIDPKTQHPSAEGHKNIAEYVFNLWSKSYLY